MKGIDGALGKEIVTVQEFYERPACEIEATVSRIADTAIFSPLGPNTRKGRECSPAVVRRTIIDDDDLDLWALVECAADCRSHQLSAIVARDYDRNRRLAHRRASRQPISGKEYRI